MFCPMRQLSTDDEADCSVRQDSCLWMTKPDVQTHETGVHG